jgi:hypothetical protein
MFCSSYSVYYRLQRKVLQSVQHGKIYGNGNSKRLGKKVQYIQTKTYGYRMHRNAALANPSPYASVTTVFYSSNGKQMTSIGTLFRALLTRLPNDFNITITYFDLNKMQTVGTACL